MQRNTFVLVILSVCWCVARNIAISDARTDDPKVLKPIDTSGFQSCISHWRNLKDDSRFIQVVDGQASYKPAQVREIVDTILLFQRSNGGWPKDYDMTAVLTSEQRDKVVSTRSNEDASYDNGNLHSQVEYLSKAYSQANDPTWRELGRSRDRRGALERGGKGDRSGVFERRYVDSTVVRARGAAEARSSDISISCRPDCVPVDRQQADSAQCGTAFRKS